MISVNNLSDRSRLAAAASACAVSIAIIAATALLLPGRTLAQAGGDNWAEPDLAQTSPPPPPPPALQLNPPTATPEPGAIQASPGGQAGIIDIAQSNGHRRWIPVAWRGDHQKTDRPETGHDRFPKGDC